MVGHKGQESRDASREESLLTKKVVVLSLCRRGCEECETLELRLGINLFLENPRWLLSISLEILSVVKAIDR